MSETTVKLSFVGRELAVEQIIRTAELNITRQQNFEPQVLLYTSQTRGSGRTSFGRHVVSLIRDNANKLVTHPLTKEIVDSYTTARTVYIDMKDAKEWATNVSFGMAFLFAVYRSVLGNVVTAELMQVEHKGLYRELLDILAQRTGHKGKWFFFVDNIDYMETLNGFKDFDKEGELYDNLFTVIMGLMAFPNCFAFCAGYSPRLTWQFPNVACDMELLILPVLQPDQISESIRRSTHKGLPLQQVLGVSDTMLPTFVNVVHQYTGGVPYLVHGTIDSLVSRAITVPYTKSGMVQVMDQKVQRDITADLQDFHPDNLTEESQVGFATFLLMNLLNTTIQTSSISQTPFGAKAVVDWISDLCLHITPDGDNEYKVVFSQFMSNLIKRGMGVNSDPRNRATKSLWEKTFS